MDKLLLSNLLFNNFNPPLPAALAALALLTLYPVPSLATEAANPIQLVDDFGTLSTVRPRPCQDQTTAAPVEGWSALPSQCAWQGLLRFERWTAKPVADNPCVSPAAYWWAAARQRIRPGSFGAWQAHWTSQIIRNDSGDVKELALIRQHQDGSWSASAWRWTPSERLPTRLWQQGRWAALAAQAGQLAQASRIPAAAPAAPVFQTWEQYLIAHPAEIRNDVGFWPLHGRCMVLDTVGIAESRFQLPYLLADSRLEQRSAMQLQLARRHPKASWLRTFRALPVDPDAQHERANYIAIWRDKDWIRGQLWLPTKRSGPVMRLRLATAAPAPPAGKAALDATANLIESELGGLARSWRQAHD